MRRQPSERDVTLCLYCPTLCLSRCPVSRATGDITFSPWGKQSAAWRLSRNLVPATRENVLPTWMCLDCLACRELCDHGVDVPINLAASRAHMARAVPPLVPRSQAEHDEEAAWRLLSEMAPAWRRVDSCQALLVPGRELLTPDAAPVLEALFKALDAVGDMVVGITRDSVRECGHHLYACGHYELARKEALQARKRFARYRKALFASPHCASFVRLRWPEMDLHLDKQYTTVVEFLGQRIDYDRGGFWPERVAIHDPCHLARHLGISQVPRDILKWATDAPPVELPWNRQRTLCCGGGEPVPSVAPDVADAITEHLLVAARESGAGVLVTSCEQCYRRLRERAGDIQVKHLFEVVAARAK